MPRKLDPDVVFAKLDALIESYPKQAFFNRPATASAIRDTEKKLGITLPDSYKQFLRRHDGGFFSIAGSKGDADWDKPSAEWNSNCLFGLKRLAKEFKDLKTRWIVDIGWEGDWNYIPFCQTDGQENLIFDATANKANERAVLDAFHEVGPEEWAPVYPSFLHLLNDYVAKRGKIETIGSL